MSRPYIQVLAGISAGVVLGLLSPSSAMAMKPLGDMFVALLRMLLAPIDEAQLVVFRILGLVMRLAPIGAFGAMAAAVGANAGETLLGLLRLLALFYGGCVLFILVVLGSVSRVIGVPLTGGLRFSIDRLMAIAIALTNIIGNTVAVLAIAKWERAFDRGRFDAFVASGAAIGEERMTLPAVGRQDNCVMDWTEASGGARGRCGLFSTDP
jgi:Na+/H+-dicarboxylate symporter